MGKKKSSYQTMAEAIALGGLKKFNVPTRRVDNRRLTIDEIKEALLEEFGKAKKASDEDMQEPDKGWGDAELANEIEWVKALDLKEAMLPGKLTEADEEEDDEDK
jgi:Zn-dependent peptidase ImmA (M78 family)